MDQGFEGLLAQITSVVKLSEDDVHRFATELYREGILSLTDADALFQMNAKYAGADPAWERLFIAALKDFVLVHADPKSWVTEEETSWLIQMSTPDASGPLGSNVDLLLQIIRYAEGVPERLGHFALELACARITHASKATPEDVERVRRALIVTASENPIWITGREADVLVRTNDAIAFSLNHASWNDLFARAIANHLMARAHPAPSSEKVLLSREHWIGDMRAEPGAYLEDVRSSFSEGDWFRPISQCDVQAQRARRVARDAARREANITTDDETDWFLKRLESDRSISLAERALIDFLKLEAPGFTQGLAVAC